MLNLMSYTTIIRESVYYLLSLRSVDPMGRVDDGSDAAGQCPEFESAV
jgi:hypothetical protein